MPAIIMQDLNGGDYAFHLIDDALWYQIMGLSDEDMPGKNHKERRESWYETVNWLIASENDQEVRPVFVLARVGRVLKTHYTQSGVIELADFEGTIRGILSLSAT